MAEVCSSFRSFVFVWILQEVNTKMGKGLRRKGEKEPEEAGRVIQLYCRCEPVQEMGKEGRQARWKTVSQQYNSLEVRQSQRESPSRC